MQTIQLSARIGAFIVRAAGLAGVSAGTLRDLTGFDAALAEDPDARISLEVESALWEAAARLSNDDAFGLHAASAIQPGAFDVMDYAVRTAPTLRVALERLARYNRLEHDVATFSLLDEGEITRVEHSFGASGAVPCRHAAEFTMASLLVVGWQMSGAPVQAQAVAFRHAAPDDLTAHREFFGVTPLFSAACNSVEFTRGLLSRSCPEADASLSKVILRHADAMLAAFPAPKETAMSQVRALLPRLLGANEATLAVVAGKLRMTPRSLQRRLSEEGTSFELLLDELRRALARRYLADPSLAISEVAYLLGYSEPSPFHRAFKRWTGHTPSELRKLAL